MTPRAARPAVFSGEKPGETDGYAADRLRDSRQRRTTERLTPSAVAACRNERFATASPEPLPLRPRPLQHGLHAFGYTATLGL
jgi:hypothetical protein